MSLMRFSLFVMIQYSLEVLRGDFIEILQYFGTLSHSMTKLFYRMCHIVFHEYSATPVNMHWEGAERHREPGFSRGRGFPQGFNTAAISCLMTLQQPPTDTHRNLKVSVVATRPPFGSKVARWPPGPESSHIFKLLRNEAARRGYQQGHDAGNKRRSVLKVSEFSSLKSA